MIKKGYKKCPYCAEIIREEAIKCRFCGEFLNENEKIDSKGLGDSSLFNELDNSIKQQFADKGVNLSWKHRQRLEEFLKQSEDAYHTAAVMFLDISGYTSMSAVLKPEYVKDIVDIFRNVCVEVIDFYNGFIVDYEGDNCLALFGAPVAYDRDVESAVRAGVEIKNRINSLPPVHEIKIAISGGIETGEILTSIARTPGRIDYNIYGAAINLAARIQSSAGKNNIVIGPDTFEFIKPLVKIYQRPPTHFKNVPGTVVTYEVLHFEKDKQLRSGYDIPLLGREKELAHALKIWSKFLLSAEITNHHNQGFVISGDPGIGKTRLALDFEKIIKNDTPDIISIHKEHAPFSNKLPWGLLRSIISFFWNGNNDDPLDLIISKLSKLAKEYSIGKNDLKILKYIFGIKESIEEFSSLPVNKIRELIKSAFSNFINKISVNTKMILIIDDYQWVDEASSEIINMLHGNNEKTDIFYIIIHRAGFALESSQFAKFPRISLVSLNESNRRALFNMLADARMNFPEIRETIITKAQGNPFFIIELINLLKNSIEKYEVCPSSDTVLKISKQMIPLSLKDMIQSHIDILDMRQKVVLQYASILGKQFTFKLIRLFQLIREGLLSKLYSLKTIEILNDMITSEGIKFLFRQNITCEVVYQSILEKKRRQLHGEIANALEKSDLNKNEDKNIILAYHYSESENFSKAAFYLKQAADYVIGLSNYTSALSFYHDSLLKIKLCPRDKNIILAEGEINFSIGRIYRIFSENKKALKYLTAASDIFSKNKESVKNAKCMFETGMVFLQEGLYDKAEKILKKSHELSVKTGDLYSNAMSLNGIGISYYSRGDFKKARHYFSKAVENDIGKEYPIVLSDLYNNIALLDWKTGNLSESLNFFNHSINLRKNTCDKFGYAAILMNKAIIEENMGRYKSAEKHYLNVIKIAETISYSQALTAAHANIGNLFLTTGRLHDALSHNAQSLDIAEKINDQRSAAIALENIALCHMKLGDYEESEKYLESGIKKAKTLKDNERLFSLDLVLCSLHLKENKPQTKKIITRLNKNRKILEDSGYECEKPRLLRILSYAYYLDKNKDKARELISEAIESAKIQGNKSEEILINEQMQENNY